MHAGFGGRLPGKGPYIRDPAGQLTCFPDQSWSGTRLAWLHGQVRGKASMTAG